MARILVLVACIALPACAGVQFSDQKSDNSLEYRTAVPAVTLTVDADCKATSQFVSLPGPPRYISFRSGLGKADTSVDFGPGGVITKFNSKTEGQTADALNVASAVMGAMGIAGLDAGGGGDKPKKCKPTLATYLISYDGAGNPSVDLSRPVFAQLFGE